MSKLSCNFDANFLSYVSAKYSPPLVYSQKSYHKNKRANFWLRHKCSCKEYRHQSAIAPVCNSLYHLLYTIDLRQDCDSNCHFEQSHPNIHFCNELLWQTHCTILFCVWVILEKMLVLAISIYYLLPLYFGANKHFSVTYY